MYWDMSMVPCMHVVYSLLVTLASAEESNPKLNTACWVTVISWCTYPVVYSIPMVSVHGSHAVVGVEVGHCISDNISKCGVGS